jgi:hypothetical protein
VHAAPDPHYAEQFGINPAPGCAAPEPSAARLSDSERTWWTEKQALWDADKKRAESAESTLAAVREAVRVNGVADERCDDAGRLSRAIRAALSATPPGPALAERKLAAAKELLVAWLDAWRRDDACVPKGDTESFLADTEAHPVIERTKEEEQAVLAAAEAWFKNPNRLTDAAMWHATDALLARRESKGGGK